MTTSKIPQTDSIKKLAKFWDSHDFTDFENQMERVSEIPSKPVKSTDSSVKVVLKPKEASAIKKMAKQRGIRETDIIHQWIREKIQAA